jgi:hypothetical protein
LQAEIESQETGRVKFRIYKNYWLAVGRKALPPTNKPHVEKCLLYFDVYS